MGWDVELVAHATGDGSLRVGVDRHSPERTPHIRRVELGVALTGEHQIVVHPLLADPESAGRAGGGDAREARRCRAPAALRFGATFSARDHEPSPAKSIDAKSTTASHVCPCSPARSPLSASDRPHQPPVPPAGETETGNTCRWPKVADYRVRFRSALPQTRSAASEKSVMARATAARRFLGI